MHTDVRETSLEAYAELKAAKKLPRQQRIIVDFLEANRPASFTRLEISRGTGLTVNATSGRCRELLDAGVLVEGFRRTCTESGNSAYMIWLPPKQLDLISGLK